MNNIILESIPLFKLLVLSQEGIYETHGKNHFLFREFGPTSFGISWEYDEEDGDDLDCLYEIYRNVYILRAVTLHNLLFSPL